MALRSSSRTLRAVVVCTALGLGGCNMHQGRMDGHASDEWSRSYTLAPGGEFQIVGGVGTIDVQAGTAPTIDVRAERIVRAATDAMARPLVSNVRITEDVAPDRIVLRAEGLAGIIVGVTVEVNFHVTVPPSTRLRLHSSAGDITVSNVEGAVVASSTNGRIEGKALKGAVEARATNGDITIDIAALTRDPVDLRATNGQIALTLPSDANANIAATCTNGTLDIVDLPVEYTGDQTRRRARARLNQGGTPVELVTINGDIHVRPRR